MSEENLEAVRSVYERWSEGDFFASVEAEEITAAGDSVIVAVYQRGVGGGSGVATELRYFHVWTFRGGRAIRLETFRERGEANEAVGLTAA